MPKVGDRILVNVKHWCRGSERGQIEEISKKGRFLVAFDGEGSGFTHECCIKQHLWLDEQEFRVLE